MTGPVNWSRIFLLDTPLLEVVVRGSLAHLAIFALLRVILKRQAGAMGPPDLLVIVMIADAAQNAMADDYSSISDGLLIVATILFWCYALDWLGYRFPPIQRLLRPAPLPLVKEACLEGDGTISIVPEEAAGVAAPRAEGPPPAPQLAAGARDGGGAAGHAARMRAGGPLPARRCPRGAGRFPPPRPEGPGRGRPRPPRRAPRQTGEMTRR